MKKICLIVGIVLVALLVLGFTSVSFGQEELFEKSRVRTIEGPQWASGEIIVKFKRGVSQNVIRGVNQRHGTSVLSTGRRARFRRIKIPHNKTVEEMVAIYRRNPNVQYAEANFIASALMVPNDTYYSYQWHMDNPVYGGINMESAWDIQTGNPTVVVAVVDTGVAYEDFGKNYKLAPDLANTSFVPGYDFVNNDEHPNDDEGHGTHVTGTIAQSTNNGIGVAGVAFNCSIMPVKVLDRNGSGYYSWIADGITWAADNGADVINLSLGGTSSSSTLEDALAYAYDKGVTIVCAAGNEYQYGNPPLYPAAYDDYCIAVGATRYDEARAYYSNTGSYLDIVAPGGDLYVDQNGDGYGDGVLQQTFDRRPNRFGYWFYQGTSMASPHVAGVAALVIANGNAATPDEVRAALEQTAEDLGTLGRDDAYGWGLVDAYAALQWTAGPVDNPPTVSITSPADGATVTGIVTITGDATDDIGVEKVDFYYDSTLIGTDTTSPYSVDWDSTAVTDGTYTITATAIDTAFQEASDSISVTVDNENDPPVADAGPDQSVNTGSTVLLDGTGSYDPDGDPITYSWVFVSKPVDSAATLSGADTATPSFVADLDGTYEVELTVSDGELSSTDSVVVTAATVTEPTTVITVTKAEFSSRREQLKVEATYKDADGNPIAGATLVVVGADGTIYEPAMSYDSRKKVYKYNEKGVADPGDTVTVRDVVNLVESELFPVKHK